MVPTTPWIPMRAPRDARRIAELTSRCTPTLPHDAPGKSLMGNLFAIRQEVSPRARLALAFISWGLAIAAWFALTYSDILPPFALPRQNVRVGQGKPGSNDQ